MITRGDGTLGTIYDRLRKRSQRKLGPVPDDSKAALLGQVAHSHYVRGVKEALQAVEESGQLTCSSCGWRIVSGDDGDEVEYTTCGNAERDPLEALLVEGPKA